MISFNAFLEGGPTLAMALAAWAHGQRFDRIMRGDPEDNCRQAIELANAALALAPDDPSVLLAAGAALFRARSQILLRGATPDYKTDRNPQPSAHSLTAT